MIDQIYLDFDNTLYDTVALSQDIRNVFLSSGLTEEQFNETMDEATKGKDGNFYNYSFEHHVNLCEEKGYHLSENILDELYKIISDDRSFHDAYDFLTWVRNNSKIVYLLTAGNPDFQMKKVATTRIPEFVDDIIICHHKKYEEVGLRKADSKQVVFVNDKVKENLEIKSNFSDVVVITKRHPHRETEEQHLASGIPHFHSLTEILDYLKTYGQK